MRTRIHIHVIKVLEIYFNTIAAARFKSSAKTQPVEKQIFSLLFYSYFVFVIHTVHILTRLGLFCFPLIISRKVWKLETEKTTTTSEICSWLSNIVGTVCFFRVPPSFFLSSWIKSTALLKTWCFSLSFISGYHNQTGEIQRDTL